MKVSRGFTLIELLVVIAIIAILAAILFPVFAQAKAAAKKTADISNQKQVALAITQYLNDSDDLYPLSWGWSSSVGWPWSYNQYFPYDYPAGAGTDGSYTIRMETSAQAWANSVQPYSKSLGVFDTPGAPLTNVGGASNALVGKQKASSGLTYNGLLMSYNSTGVAAPADLIMVWTGRGNADADGAVLANPALVCPEVNMPCQYVPAVTGCANTVNGQTSTMFLLSGSMWVYSKGANTAFADGHVRHRMLGATLAPADTDWRVDPYTQYDANGFGAYYWWDGCHAWLFRPDYVP